MTKKYPQEEMTTTKKGMTKTRKVGIGVGITVLAFFAIVMIVGTAANSGKAAANFGIPSSTPASNTVSAEKLPTNQNLASAYHIITKKATDTGNSSLSFENIDGFRQYALKKINEDRAKFGFQPVKLSSNPAAQAHSEDLLVMGYKLSHWTSDGMKPYMGYTLYGGAGAVTQNAASRYYEAESLQYCNAPVCRMFKIDVETAIQRAELDMMNHDEICCNNGHRINILDPNHTHVSIGLAWNDTYFAMIQNFENNYIEFDKPIVKDDTHIQLSGKVNAPSTDKISRVAIFYDAMPNHDVYLRDRDEKNYDQGELVGVAIKPGDVGKYYEKPEDLTLIEAQTWKQFSDRIDVSFDLSPVMNKSGVYTIYTMFQNERGEEYPVTTYSVWVDQN